MKIDLLTRILDGVTGVRKDGAAWLIPDDIEISVYIGLAAEVLTIARATRLIGNPDVVTIENSKGERFYFSPDAIAGLKVGPSEMRGGVGRNAGFR